MWPIGPLMHEHRLIERMIKLLAAEADRLDAGGEVDPALLTQGVDFIRTYADRCHHGKEEDILFRDLDRKDLPSDIGRTMGQLIEEHVMGREMVARLVAAKDRHLAGRPEAKGQIVEVIRHLADFYPAHIIKEDKAFFYPAMELFDDREKDAMLAEMYEFDRQLIHEKYRGLVEELEKA